MITRRAFALSTLAGIVGASSLQAQRPEDANYDEDRVPKYALPPLLTFADGRELSRLVVSRCWIKK